MRRIILVLIAGVLVGILGVHALQHLSVRQLLPEEFSDCSGNLSWAITLIFGTMVGAGCARYFRYAAYGSFRVSVAFEPSSAGWFVCGSGTASPRFSASTQLYLCSLPRAGAEMPARKGHGALRVPLFKSEMTTEYMVRWTAAVWLAAATKYYGVRIVPGQSALSELLIFVAALAFFGGVLLVKYDGKERQRQKKAFEEKLHGLDPAQLDTLARCKPPESSECQRLLGVALLSALAAGWIAQKLCDWASVEAGLRQGITALTVLTCVSVGVVPIHLRQQYRARTWAEKAVLDAFGRTPSETENTTTDQRYEVCDFDDAGWAENGSDCDYCDAEGTYYEQHEEPSSEQADERGAGGVREWFDILKVSPNATEQEIKNAWRKAIVKVHPDRFGGMPREVLEHAEGEAKKLNAAYESGLTTRKK